MVYRINNGNNKIRSSITDSGSANRKEILDNQIKQMMIEWHHVDSRYFKAQPLEAYMWMVS